MDDYIIIEEWTNKSSKKVEQTLAGFNDAIRNDSDETGAEWLDKEQFASIYNFMRRYNNTYKSISCELMITADPIMDDEDYVEEEEILCELGNVLRASLRKSDSIMREGNQFFLLLPEMTEQNRIVVVNRLISKLQQNGIYYLVDISIDAMMIGPDMEYSSWFNVAV